MIVEFDSFSLYIYLNSIDLCMEIVNGRKNTYKQIKMTAMKSAHNHICTVENVWKTIR